MIPATPMLIEIVVKIMIEFLSVLALASKQIKQGRLSKCAVRISMVHGLIYRREVHKKITGGK